MAALTEEQYITELENLRHADADNDGISTREIAAALGIGEVAARRRIQQWVASGNLEPHRKRIRTIAGITQTIPCYRQTRVQGITP